MGQVPATFERDPPAIRAVLALEKHEIGIKRGVAAKQDWFSDIVKIEERQHDGYLILLVL